jgi:hypothetical protein
VHAGSLGDLGEGKALPFQVKQRAVLGRALGYDPLPQFPRLGDLAGARQERLQRVVLFDSVQRFFARGSAFVPLNTIEQTVARHDKQEAAQVIGVDKAPAGLAKAAEHIRPDRLDNIHGIEFGPERSRKVPADHSAQVGLEEAEEMVRGRIVAAAKLHEQIVQGFAHGLPCPLFLPRQPQQLIVFGRFDFGPSEFPTRHFTGCGSRCPGNQPDRQPALLCLSQKLIANPC